MVRSYLSINDVANCEQMKDIIVPLYFLLRHSSLKFNELYLRLVKKLILLG